MMDAKTLYRRLENDFITPNLSDDWAQYMESISDYLTDEFKARSMGLVCDNTTIINKVYTAVFPSNHIMRYILSKDETQLLLFVHHPSIWDIRKYPEYFQQMDRGLLQQFKEKHISIYNLHVPLDAYGKYSTSVSLAKILGFDIIKPFYHYFGAEVAVYCATQISNTIELNNVFESETGHQINLYPYGTNEIKNGVVAVVAGSGNNLKVHEDMLKEGVNTLVTGITARSDWSEEAHKFAQEYQINILGGTHYSTEKPGCQAMCEYFNSIDLPSEFIEDTPMLEDL